MSLQDVSPDRTVTALGAAGHEATSRGGPGARLRPPGVGDAGVTGVGHGGVMKRQQTGLMVLRVWTEEGSTEPLRVDVRQNHDVSTGFHRTLTLTDVDLVLVTVRRFLETGRAIGAVGSNGDG